MTTYNFRYNPIPTTLQVFDTGIYQTITDGERGYQGFQGSSNGGGGSGNQGYQGLQGLSESGYQGFQGLSAVGIQGFQGLSIQGSQGQQGRQGFQGVSAVGTQGRQGYQGHQGRQGFQGVSAVGTQGFRGFAGEDGAVGATGPTGPSGGPTGSTGPTGGNGNQGSQGLQGDALGFQGFQGLSSSSSGGLEPSEYTAISYNGIASLPSFPQMYFYPSNFSGSYTAKIQICGNADARYMLAVTNNNSTFYVSTDFGKNFNSVASNGYVLGAVCMSYSGQYQYVLSRNDSNNRYWFSYSSNFGSAWTTSMLPFSDSNFGLDVVGGIACSSDGKTVVVNGDTSVYRSDDYGVTFTDIKSLFGSYSSYNLFSYGVAMSSLGQYWAVALYTFAGDTVIALTEDYGATFSYTILSSISTPIGNVSISESGKYICFSNTVSSTNIYSSRDYGATFTSTSIGTYYGKTSMTLSGNIMLISPNIWYDSSQRPLYYSKDYGASWSAFTSTTDPFANSTAYVWISPNGQFIATNEYITNGVYPIRIACCVAEDNVAIKTAYVNTTFSSGVESTLFSTTLDPLAVYDVVRIKGVGRINTNGENGLVMRVKFGGSTILETDSINISTYSVANIIFDVEIFVAGIDTSYTYTEVVSGNLYIGDASTTTWGGDGFGNIVGRVTTTTNTTQPQTVSMTVYTNTVSFDFDYYYIEKVKAKV